MAIYGQDFYGKSYYGNPVLPQFTVEPFTIIQPDYGRLVLRWVTPGGDWRFLRLLKSQYGYPVSETDGTILVDADIEDGVPAPTYDDSNVTAGRYYYYAIFVGTFDEDTGWTTWIPAGRTQGLPVTDFGYQDRLWSRMPLYHQKLDMLLTDEGPENAELKRFLSTFGFHFDMIRTEYDSMLSMYDTDRASYSALVPLGEMYGVVVEPEIPARLNRMRVKNAAYINQQKGTLPGLRNLINSVTGWDADIQIGRNQMLNTDQASFVHPDYDTWSPFSVYIAGDRVEFNGFYFQAVQGSQNRAPATGGGTTAYWAQMSGVTDTTLLNPETLGQSTWGVYDLTNNAAMGNSDAVLLASGFQSAVDPTVSSSNALVIKNTKTTSITVGASSISAIAAPVWSSSVAYKTLNYVTYNGQIYQAKQNNTGRVPDTSPVHWQPSLVSAAAFPHIDLEQPMKDGIPIPRADEGVPYVVSAYVRAHSNTLPSGATARIFVDWYDNRGILMRRLTPPSFPTAYDGFDIPVDNLSTDIDGLRADTGHTWTVVDGTWVRTGSYVYQNDGSAGVAAAIMDLGKADCSVGVTVNRYGPAGTNAGLMLRYTDMNNHIRVSRTGVTVLSGGVQTDPVVFGTPLTDGDRVTVVMAGTSLTVGVNHNLLWQGTVTANATATKHGIYTYLSTSLGGALYPSTTLLPSTSVYPEGT